MFEEWGFLLGEIWVLLILAALLGLLAGWLIFKDSVTGMSIDQGELNHARAQLRTAKDDLEKCEAHHEDKDARISALQLELRDLEKASASAGPSSKVEAIAAGFMGGTASHAPAAPEADFDGDGIVEGAGEGAKPATLTAPRDGKADDLKRIKGVGAKLENLCNQMGFYHYDQIANWTTAEQAWVDANLEGFKGRVSRDDWIDQAKRLAAGEETEFSKRVDKGDVYES